MDDRGLMLAFVMFEGTLEGRRAEWLADKADREGKKDAKGPARSEFAAARARAGLK